ncbi:hypothetical protein [Kaarinaea lacus]
MLGFIYRLVRDFEIEHGIRPNLIYLNHFHVEHLKSAFDRNFTISEIMETLDMELLIENNTLHPHVAWTQVANKAVAF